MGTSRPLSVFVAATAATALTVGLTAASAGAASPYDPKPVKAGAGWLSGQLTDGLVHNEQFEFDDIGLSIDVAIGLDAAGKKPKVVTAITKAVAKNVASYIGVPPEEYAGATAKTAVLAAEQGKNPHALGGVDLVGRLEGRVSAAAPIAGRIEDASSFGDFANVIGQAYAVAALTDIGSAKAASATAFLLQQQCDKGFFRQYLTSDKTRADQSCQGAPAAERGPSTDATALAVLALRDVEGAPAKAAVKHAVAWLKDTQLADGSFTDTGKANGAANSNSTGLAGWALGAAGASNAAGKAAIWVRNLQVPGNNPCSGKLAKEAGAIAYDDSAYGTAQGFGVKKKDRDQWRRASAQALPVLRWAPRAEGEFTADGPSTVRAGDTFRIRLTGAAPGERVCVSGAGSTYEFPGKRQATTQVSFAVAPGTASRTYRVWLGSHYRDVSVRVTG